MYNTKCVKKEREIYRLLNNHESHSERFLAAGISVRLCVQSFSIMMEEAPPPPLQMLATPFWPGLRAYTRWFTILNRMPYFRVATVDTLDCYLQ